jgi:hypothetical protein
MKRHHVVVVPGIPAWTPLCKLLSYPWKLAGFNVHVEDIHWTARPADFQSKLEALIARIDAYAASGTVSIVGISAGGIALCALFAKEGTCFIEWLPFVPRAELRSRRSRGI